MTRRGSAVAASLIALAAGCANETAKAPNPMQYQWPAAFAYNVDYVNDAQRNGALLLHYAETKVMRFRIENDESYVLDYDSVLKTSHEAGGPLRGVSFAPEDTLAWRFRLGASGEIRNVQAGCDPAVPQCAGVLPSTVPLELRRIFPQLSPWPVPRNSSWVDTLDFDDAARPSGSRGSVITTYRVKQDTAIGAEAYWVLEWQAVRRSFAAGASMESSAAQESGMTYIEKRRLMPIFSTWVGVVPAPPELRARGATGSAYRGRAYLVGSDFGASPSGLP